MTSAIALAALLDASTGAAAAGQNIGTATVAVVVHHLDIHPRSEKAARVALQRLGDAAMEACGASSFSLREVKDDARASSCWRRSMADTIAGIGDPMLSAVYVGEATGR